MQFSELNELILIPINNIIFPYEETIIVINKKFEEIIEINKKIILCFYKNSLDNSIILENTFISKYGTLATILKKNVSDNLDEIEILVETTDRVFIINTLYKNNIFYGDATIYNYLLNNNEYQEFNNLKNNICDILYSQNSDINIYKISFLSPLHFIFYVLKQLGDFNYKLSQFEEDQCIIILRSIFKTFFHLNKKFAEKIEHEIYEKFKKNIEEHQKQYLLNEQYKTLKKELEKYSPSEDNLLKEEIENHLYMPNHIKEILLKEWEKIKNNNMLSSEYSVTKNYINISLSFPWGKYSDLSKINLEESEKILDLDHYGLKKIKQHILYYITAIIRIYSYTKDRKEISKKMKVLLLLGPPGVGKTSICQTIGKCMHRETIFISLASISHTSDLVGHRRTYVGAFPGMIVNEIIKKKILNPLIILDELDKISNEGLKIILQILDETQNKDFVDLFLSYPIDLSECMFMLTANSIDNLPDFLLSRLEIIEIDGYTSEEKLMIVKNFLLPKIEKNLLINNKNVFIEKKIILHIINKYTKEMGIRQLEKFLNNLFFKIIYKIEKKEISFPLIINSYNFHKFIEKKQEEDFNLNLEIGESIGLAWTSLGGKVLKIQSKFISEEKSSLLITGNIGKVMEESIKIAYSLIEEKYINHIFFKNHKLHIHIPAGGIPKDGPSAGITIYTSLLLAINNKITPLIAMTGEISLTGEILPIGGVKQKILAANMYSIKEIILPKKNYNDYLEIKDLIKKNKIKFHFLSHINELDKIFIKKKYSKNI